MGRPRLHDKSTATALLDAAERIVESEGVQALTMRRVAQDIAETTRAVYSSLGSKQALIAGLGVRAFDLLGETVRTLPLTQDPATDLVSAGVWGFRAWALGHPALFRLGVQLTDVPTEAFPEIQAAAERSLVTLHDRIHRLREDRGLGSRSLGLATLEFHATCEGLAAVELRHPLRPEDGLHLWTDTLRSLIAGWRQP